MVKILQRPNAALFFCVILIQWKLFCSSPETTISVSRSNTAWLEASLNGSSALKPGFLITKDKWAIRDNGSGETLQFYKEAVIDPSIQIKEIGSTEDARSTLAFACKIRPPSSYVNLFKQKKVFTSQKRFNYCRNSLEHQQGCRFFGCSLSMCCGNHCWFTFVLWCGYFSVSFQPVVLRQLVIYLQHQETTVSLFWNTNQYGRRDAIWRQSCFRTCLHGGGDPR